MWMASCCPCTDMPVHSFGIILFAVEMQAYHSKRVCSSNDSIVWLLPHARPFLSRMRSGHLGSKVLWVKGFRTRTIMPQCQQTCYVLYTGRLLSKCFRAACLYNVHAPLRRCVVRGVRVRTSSTTKRPRSFDRIVPHQKI